MTLDRDTFHTRRQEGGYDRVHPEDLPVFVGGRVMYSVHDMIAGTSRYLSGGILIYVDPGYRYMYLKNPSMEARWCVQLPGGNVGPGIVVKLYAKRPATAVDPFRKLLQRMDQGDFTVVKLK